MSGYQFKQIIKGLPFVRTVLKTSYSLSGEDIVISQYFKEKTGTYLDIGSGHPIWTSNTYLLYKKGWKGILVDPIKFNGLLSRTLRRRDKFIWAAVSDASQITKFYQLVPYEYSTFDEHVVHQLISVGEAKCVKTQEISTVRFNEIKEIKGINFNQPTFLNIDSEGWDYRILKTIDFETYPFEVICIEDFNSPLERISPIGELMKINGYTFFAHMGTSSIYIRKSLRNN
jgi:hypothetical protein